MVLVSKLRSQLIIVLSVYTTQRSPHPAEGSGGCERQGVSVWVADLMSSAGVPDLGRTQPGELHEVAHKILPVSERRRPPHSVSVPKPQQTPGFWPQSLGLSASSPRVPLCDQKPALCFRASHRTLPRPTHLPCPNCCLYSPPRP